MSTQILSSRALAKDLQLLLVIACASQLAAQPADTVSPTTRARDVVMRHMAAIGGIDAYSAVQSVRMVVTMRMPMGFDMRVDTWATKPNLVYMQAKSEFSTAEAGFDGKVAWMMSTDEGAKILSRPPDMLNGAAFDPLTALALHDVKHIGVRTRGGKKMDALQMIGGDGQLYTQYYDAGTGLFSWLDVGDLSAPVQSIRFEKYKKFGNLLYATVIVTKLGEGNESVGRVTTVDHKPIDPKRYELPKAIRDLAARNPR